MAKNVQRILRDKSIGNSLSVSIPTFHLMQKYMHSHAWFSLYQVTLLVVHMCTYMLCELTCAGAHVYACMQRRGHHQVAFLRDCLPCADLLVLRQSVTAPSLID